jgi:murein DD-endopeptidase MepM/ murein hydrolase activator NlpD
VNRVVLQHDDGALTAYLHLKQGSIPERLKKGARVKAGQVLAQVGNSGASSEPHLQFFAFRLGSDGAVHPLPVAFANAFEDAKGTRPVDGVPVGGTQIHFLERR